MIESSSVRRALSRVRDEISPTRDDKARLRARILAPAALLGPESAGQDAMTSGAASARAAALQGAAGPGAAAPGAATAASLTRWAALKAAGSVGAAMGLTLLGVGGGMGFWLGHEVASPRSRDGAAVEMVARAAASTVPVLERAASAPTAGSPQAAPADAALAGVTAGDVAAGDVAAGDVAASEARRGIDSHRTDVPPRAHPHRRAQPSLLNDELALLRRVERALRNNDPALARALLGELDERFPDSRLAEERSAARRIADCRSGEPGAIESARAFLREHGASVYRKRVVLACALESEKSSAAPTMTNPESADTHDR